MRGKACTVCAHREAAAIDLALARGVGTGAIARRYDVSTDSLYRHRKAHLPAQLRARLIAGPDTEIDLDRLRETESQSLCWPTWWRCDIACSPRSTWPRNAPTPTWSPASLGSCIIISS